MRGCSGLVVVGSLCLFVAAAGCSNESAGGGSGDIVEFSSALTAPIENGFEDGTLQGWIPRGGTVVLTNTTEAAFAGTRSLKTTGRTAGFNGPSLSLTGQLVKGAGHQVGVSVRLAPGTAPTTIRVTMQRTLVGGTQAFDTIAQNTSVTDAAWVTLNGTYSFSTDVTDLLLYVEATDATASFYIDAFSIAQTSPAPLQADFEDGTLQGWIPRGGSVVLTNTTEAAFAGTRSLKTTGRTAGFNGPSINLLGQLSKGATYQVTVSARLVAATPATTVSVTMQRTPTGGSTAFDTIVSNVAVTDAAWVTLNGTYSFNTDVTGLLLYVESPAATASYYIDSFSITQLAPPPGPPANTAGATSSFESNTAEGWTSRTGVEVISVSAADAHSGGFSLLTTNRTATFRGPAFNVTNVMFNGSRYRVELWAKLAPGEVSTQLRVSLERRLGTAVTSFHTLIGNTTVTADGWVQFATTFDMTLANTSLSLYVESASGAQSFYIDDFKITFINPAVAERDIPSVYQTLADQFPVGAAVYGPDLVGEAAFLLTRHHNSITSENDMKWDATEPQEGNFTFANADAQVAFAKANNMRVWGHTLVWHAQTPAWVFNDASGAPMTPTPENRALLIQRMRNHIQGVVTHFGTDVYTWDVVNEAIDPSQPDGYRRSPWFNIIGPEFIDIAFQAAREFAPTAKLYYNDFSTTDTTKLAFIAALVSGMRSRGVPIDGVGHQMHNNVDFPSGQAVVNAINTIHALGVENAITELDVSIYSGSFSTPVTDYTAIPADRFLRQGYRYLTFFQAFKQLQGKIKSVTLWGKADDHTWLTSATRVDGPLLFDTSLRKKLAYWAVVDPLQLPGADLSTTMTAVPTTVAAGQGVTYTITVTNNVDTDTEPFKPTNDDLPAAAVSLTTAVPANAVMQSLAVPSGWSCAAPPAGGVGPIQCTIATLAPGASATFTLAVAMPNCAAANGLAIAASANVTSTTADPNPAPNNAASAAVSVSNSVPVITAAGPLDTTVECATSFVDPGATATDTCEGPVAVTTTGTVNVGQVATYAIRYDAVDQAGGSAVPVTRTVHVTDTTAPVVSVLGANPAAVECGTAFADPGATATDSCVGPLAAVATGAVDVNMPGGYAIGYAATDPSGNTGMATRLVTVADTTAPAIDVIDLTILGPHLKIVVEDQTITINGHRSSRHLCGRFRHDDHDIDLDGGTIRVNGRRIPTDGRTIVLLPANHERRSFTIADLVSRVTDRCDATLGLADAVITQVTSDEPEDARGRRGGGDGNTEDDIVIGAGCRSTKLRMERAGGGNGRVYTIALAVQDSSGNRTTATVQVMVPPHQGSVIAVDDGPRYTVTCP